VFKLVNEERDKRPGCRALRNDSNLHDAARAHSMDMARYRYHSHTGRDGSEPWQRMAAAGYDVQSGWAENIARGYPTPAAVMADDGQQGHRQHPQLQLRHRYGAVRATNGEIY
jgi:uncharacterized protein YkwD